MTGVIVNVLTVILGSACGLLFRKAIPEKISQGVMTALGLCTVYIGVDGLVGGYAGNMPLIVILSMVPGAALGYLLRLDDGISALGSAVEKTFSTRGEQGSVARGFVTASLVFCVGAMTVVGSLQAGLEGDNTLLFTKSLLDLISSSMLAVSLGFGVMLAALFVLVFQGGLVLLSGVLQPVLTDGAVDALVCVGSLLILALGLNLIGVSKIKVANFLPALVFGPAVWWLWEWVASL